ncbi:MAG TPA: MBL fold metallo-hydrolase [Candidatus Acidoferrum sp.]|jgi:glyoxylase-like metal-dependent hydrolase (beta-lactamase superfamily II)|nr:MBL fold metallo-hydrolase [Candidatus Acidoferrum sp.]
MGRRPGSLGQGPSASANWREQIDDDVIRLSLPFQHGFVNSYLVLGTDGPRLIDTGSASSLESSQLVAHLAALGMTVDDIRAILLTHSHQDHVGMAAQIARASGATVLIHRLEMVGDSTFASVQPPQSWLSQHGLPEARSLTPRQESEAPPRVQLVSGGETIPFGPLKLELHWTPGHSPGLISAFDRERGLLFSTDHLLRASTPLAIRQQVDDDPVQQYMHSLDVIQGLPAKRVLPGHGRSFADVDAAIADARRAQLGWLESIWAAVPLEGATTLEIAKRMTWIAARQPAEVWLAVARAAAYLQHLEMRGRLRHEAGPPVKFFPAI